MWTDLVDALRAAIFGVAQVCNGSLGAAVCLVSLALRLALFPLTLKLARRALRHQRRLIALQPELERLRRRHAGDPAGQMRVTAEFYRKRGVRPVDLPGVVSGLVQLPVLGALFAAVRGGIGAGVRFLGIADLAKPNLTLALLATALTVAGVSLAPTPDPARDISIVPLMLVTGFTLWLLWSASSLFTLAAGVGSLVNVAQALLLSREDRRRAS